MSNVQPAQSRAAAVARMCEAELTEVNRRYGSNRGPGLEWLLYHNETHSRHVRDTAKSLARELARRGMIDERDVDLIEIAAAFHDHEQNLGSGANERASADAAIDAMRGRPDLFNERDIQKVESMILSTVVTIDNGSLHQAASPTDLLQACIADADLSALAARDGVATALRLFCEGEIKAGRMPVPRSAHEIESMVADPRALDGFLHIQSKLVSKHRYLLDISQERFGPGLEANTRATDQLLQSQESGASFAQLYLASIAHEGGIERNQGYSI